uniref:Uncharacterized protein LOC8273017 n=1 Tax=Rhizophora mucronata TaxID=61149 RepID=A0A2P2J5L2_RHIMU
MAVSSAPYSWIPEDDCLLKNAVEMGASLEALAKGAVQFSRKFTVRELRERWHSLLYDPDVSAEASAGMVQFELFGSKLSKNIGSKENDEISAKRKVGSIRRLYYARKKKTHVRSLKAPPDMGFLGTTDGNDCIGIESVCGENATFEDQPLGGSCVFGDHDHDQDPFGIGKAECCYELPEFEDEGHGGEKVIGPHDLDVNRIGLTEVKAVESVAMLQDKCNVDGLNSSSAISECDFVDLPESLLNIPNEDELAFMDTDKRDLVDKSSNDNHNLLLISSPNDAHDDAADVKEPPILVSDTSLGILGGTCPADLENNEESHSGDRGMNPPQSTSAPNTWLPEHGDGEMECILNTEDPEIPYNDIVCTTKEFGASVDITTSKEASYLSSSCVNQKDDKKGPGLMNKEGNPAQSLTISKMVRHDVLPLSAPRPVIIAHREPSQCISAMTTPIPVANPQKVEPLCVYHSTDIPPHTKSRFPEKAISVPERDFLMQNEEGSQSDEDVPCFSDIEAMILEMDLCQENPDSSINREISSYQSEDIKRKIIRLEQCARSSMQRAIASHGALAVLYGRHLKHYIKESKVILGRATDDMDVDIDLGREGPANKISRLQALINMEGDGSFRLRNLGKSPIFLNGTEVATGKSSRLSSNSLMEVRNFLFSLSSKFECLKLFLRGLLPYYK